MRVQTGRCFICQNMAETSFMRELYCFNDLKKVIKNIQEAEEPKILTMEYKQDKLQNVLHSNKRKIITTKMLAEAIGVSFMTASKVVKDLSSKETILKINSGVWVVA